MSKNNTDPADRTFWDDVCINYHEGGGTYCLETRRLMLLSNVGEDPSCNTIPYKPEYPNKPEKCEHCKEQTCRWVSVGNPIIDMVKNIMKEDKINTPGNFRLACYDRYLAMTGEDEVPYCCLERYKHLFPNPQVEVYDKDEGESWSDDEYYYLDGPFWTYETDLFTEMDGCYSCHNVTCDKDRYAEKLRNYEINLVKHSNFSKKRISSMVLDYYKDLQKKDKLTNINVNLDKSCVNCKTYMSDKINEMEDRLTYQKMFNFKICGSELREIGDIDAKELAAYRKWRKECNLIKVTGKRIVTPNKKRSTKTNK